MAIRDRVAAHLQRRFAPMDLPLMVRFWDGREYAFGIAPSVFLSFTNPKPLKRLLRGDLGGLIDCYVGGDLTVDGRIEDIIQVGLRLTEAVSAGRRFVPGLPAWAGRLRPVRRDRAGDAARIRYHYDVSNEFYGTWLDRNMVYSCAYFRTGAEDIDAAQENKLDHVCRKLRLAPGERFLDIGCGWGALPIWAARHYGVGAVGITVSERQYEYARERVRAEGLTDRVEIRLQDYRDIEGAAAYDKIASIGMVEHVGRANLPVYFATIRRALKPGGLLLNHGIATGDAVEADGGPPDGGFMNRYVFPGGELVHISRMLEEVRRGGFETLDVENLRAHYARTLLHWVRRLEQHREDAERLASAAHYRIWRMFMAGCAYAFDRGWMSVFQVVATRPTADGAPNRPWTREHQYGLGRDAAMAGPLDWNDS